jgi:hypothetical protein
MPEIKEPELKRRHNQILENLIVNQLNFSWEYEEGQNGDNSTIQYSLEINGIAHYGFICVDKDEFHGAVCDLRTLKHLALEGFSDEQISEEPTWVTAPCPMSFICMLAKPLINDLTFTEDLITEFQQISAKNTRKNARKG